MFAIAVATNILLNENVSKSDFNSNMIEIAQVKKQDGSRDCGLYNRSLTLQSHRMRFILHIPTTRESLYSHPVNIQIFTGEYTGEFPNI